MSRHWDYRATSGPKGGFYTARFENRDAKTTIEVKFPAKGIYHGDPDKPLSKSAAEKIAKKIKAVLNENT